MRDIVVLLTCGLSASGLFAGDERPAPSAIQVVKSWRELSAQPAIALKNGTTARLGIQALSAPRNGAVLLYCLTDGYWPGSEQNLLSSERVGPFKVKVRAPIHDAESMIKYAQMSARIRTRAPGQLVFAQVVMLSMPGTHTVQVLNGTKDVVGEATIECTKESMHAWSTLVLAKEQAPRRAMEAAEINILTATGEPGVPSLHGDEAILYRFPDGTRGPHKFSDDDPLPTLPLDLPETAPLTVEMRARATQWIADLGHADFDKRALASTELIALGPPAREVLQEAARGTRDAEIVGRLKLILKRSSAPFEIELDAMAVTATTPMAFEKSFFEDHFLARWWVNGKPVMKVQVQEMHRNGGGLVVMVSQAKFNLARDLAALGAKSGDKIGLQLLFCPDGQRLNHGHLWAEHLQMAEEDNPYPAHFPLVSNKIEFSAP